MSYIDPYDAAFLRGLVAKGGPEPADYDDLDAFYVRLGNAIRVGQAERAAVNAEFHALLGPVVNPNNLHGKTILKPYGYSGDFEIIDNIYTYWVSPDSNFVNWDRYSHAQPATEAVRNRKQYFIDLVMQRSQKVTGRFEVLNIASGPGRDVLEACEANRQNGNRDLHFDCVDMDPHAIAYAQNLCAPYREQIDFHLRNALRYKAEKKYDLVWSAGLFDYLDERWFVALLQRLLAFLKPGGLLVIGNFSPDNPSRDFMEAGGWFLNHRDPEQLIALAKAGGADPRQIKVESEPQGINLFLHLA